MIIPGKLPMDILIRYVLSKKGKRDAKVVIGPMWGVDAAVIRYRGEYLVLSTDPITAAESYIGILAINITTNDVAVMGGVPSWLLVTLLFRENITTAEIDDIMTQIDTAARRIGVAIVGGHSEITPGINRTFIIGTAIGKTKRYIYSGGAKVGDQIIMTKGVAIEGTGVLAHDFERTLLEKGLSQKLIRRGKKFIYKTSILDEAKYLLKKYSNYITSMHDPTEGGVFSGLHEVADASGVGFKIYFDKINISRETLEICNVLNIDPYKLLGSGALIITASPEVSNKIIKELRMKGIWADIIGNIKSINFGRKLIKDGKIYDLPRPERDEIWKLY